MEARYAGFTRWGTWITHKLRPITAVASTLPALASPVISRPPVDTSVPTGQNATFTVAATGSGPLAYQWERNGFPITGATASTFVIGGATRASADAYDVTVSDVTGSTRSNSARLWVAPSNYPTQIIPNSAFALQLSTNDGMMVNSIITLADGVGSPGTELEFAL